MARLAILYNSVCPVCREGICYFERRVPTRRGRIDFIDVSANPQAFADIGVSLDDVRRKLHARLPEGQIVRGWPAVNALWRETPGYEWLAKLGNAPGLRTLSGATYASLAQLLWWWNRASGRW
ncbi:MAG: DUF393 domain-containing protein [Pseudomonadota bacterium]